MKKKINLIFLIVILLISVLPLFTMNFKKDSRSELLGRKLVNRPEIIRNGKLNKRFLIDTAKFVKDNIGFRETMLGIYGNLVDEKTTLYTGRKNFIGKDGWLFYKGEDNNVLKGFQTVEQIDEKKIAKIESAIKKLDRWCKDRNIKFYFMPIPNKETIYEDYLPDIFVKKKLENNLDVFIKHLKKNSDVRIIYPKESILKLKNKEDLYHKYDTHWNYLGGYYGYKDICKELGIKDTPLDKIEEIKDYKEGDLLSGLLYKNLAIPYTEYKPKLVTEAKHIYKENKGNYSRDIYESDTGVGELVFLGDSFRNLFKEYLATNFKKSTFIHRDINIFNEIDKKRPNVVIFQFVERFLFDIVKNMNV